MGTWGTAIFSDDFASDIKTEFRDKIGFGKSPEEATIELMDSYKDSLTDPEESSVFYIALSATQWQLGRLQSNIKQKAIEIIESEVDLQRWIENPKDLKKRKTVLEQLKQQLLSEQPVAKKIAIPFIRTTKFEVGDLLAYHLTNNKICVIRVISISQDHCGDRYPRVEILNYFDSKIPTIEEASNMDILLGEKADSPKPSNTTLIAPYGKKDPEPWDRITIMAKNVQTRTDYFGSTPFVWWKNFDEYIIERFKK